MKLKKLIALTCTFVMAASLLTGCGSSKKSSEVLNVASPVPTLMVFIGGADASDREARASAEKYGHLESSIAPEATFMEKAIQVGHPHSLQFFFGDNLKISRPLSAIILYPPYVATITLIP